MYLPVICGRVRLCRRRRLAKCRKWTGWPDGLSDRFEPNVATLKSQGMTVARPASRTLLLCRVHGVEDRRATQGRPVLRLTVGGPPTGFGGSRSAR